MGSDNNTDISETINGVNVLVSDSELSKTKNQPTLKYAVGPVVIVAKDSEIVLSTLFAGTWESVSVVVDVEEYKHVCAFFQRIADKWSIDGIENNKEKAML